MNKTKEFPKLALAILYFTSVFDFVSGIIYLLHNDYVVANGRIVTSMLFLGISAILQTLIHINENIISN